MMEVEPSNLRSFFNSGQTRDRGFRRRQLRRLEAGLRAYYTRLVHALAEDLGKSETEAYASEFAPLYHELRFARRNLAEWMKPRPVPTPLHLQPAKSEIHSEPLGVVLIIGTWNYPVQLVIGPLVAAIAAGNCAIVKPSELAPQTSAVLKTMLASIFPGDFVAVQEGGATVTEALLQHKFDHIFYTGSERVGRLIYEAAARQLTPVTLELGGKSPAIVCWDADLDTAAKRLVWGKFLNAGQTCVAPDYLYIQSSVRDELLERMKTAIQQHFRDGGYSRIVNRAHFERLERLSQSGKIFLGGERNPEKLMFAPTLLTDISWSDPIMREEIFGPLFPILTFENLDEVLTEIALRPKPLAAYLFSENRKSIEAFLKLSFGGGCLNDTVVHLSNPHLPFGGVGQSGFGAYHGERGFKTFSHEKPILRKSQHMDVSLRYPPYSPAKFSMLRKLLRLSKLLD